MKVTIIREDGRVVVDGVARRVDLSDLHPCHAVHWDSARGTGKVEFTFDDTVPCAVRDLEAEGDACAAARAAGHQEPEGMLYKTVQVRRPDMVLEDFAPYAIYVERWVAAAPPPPPQLTPDEIAQAAVDGKDRLLFEVNFDQENRLRALEGKTAITRAQYRDALIARWKLLNP